MPFPLIMTFAAFAMLLCSVLLFTDKGGLKRKLQERVLATHELKNQPLGTADIVANVTPTSHPLLRLASLLGYAPDLPAGYAASPRTVGALSAIMGLVAFNLSKHVVSPFILGSVAALLIARFLFRRKSRAYSALVFRQIPDAMALMLRAVRAGLPVAEAIRNVGRESMSPTREEFARVAGEAAFGMPVEIAVRRLSERTGIQEYAFFAVILGLHGQTGGNLSETLENLADMVRRRVAMAAKSKALSAEGRLSAGVIAALPFFTGLLTFAFNSDYMSEFWTSPGGPTLIAVFVVLLCTGLLVSHLLIQKSMQD